jgi:hypothetical protein
MENPANQLPVLSRSLARLSTQTDYNSVSLEEAASSVRECAEIQNTGAVLKHGYRRQLGVLIGALEEKEGPQARKKVAADLLIPFVDVKKAVNEAAVPQEDYDRYIASTLKRSREITDAGALRAGKEFKKPKLLTAAARVSQKLSVWIDSRLIKSLEGEYSGSREELKEAAEILEKLSSQFSATAIKLRGKL